MRLKDDEASWVVYIDKTKQNWLDDKGEIYYSWVNCSTLENYKESYLHTTI